MPAKKAPHWVSALDRRLAGAVRRGGLVLFVGSQAANPSVPSSQLSLVSRLPVKPSREQLSELYNQASRDFEYPDFHRVIARIPVRLIFTSRIDNALDRYLRDSRRSVLSVASAYELSKSQEGSFSTVLIKLFGDLAAPETISGFANLPPAESVSLLLERALPLIQDKLLLFVGFSESSDELLEILRLISSVKIDREVSSMEALFWSSSSELSKSVAAAAFDQCFFGTKSGVLKILDRLSVADPGAESSDAETVEALERYLRFQVNNHRYTWTIDPRRKVDALRASFHLKFTPVHGTLRLEQPETAKIERGREGSSAFINEMETYRRIFVVGEAGVGKTTFLMHLASSLAQPPALQSWLPVFFSSRDLRSVQEVSLQSMLKQLERSLSLAGLENAVLGQLEKGRVALLFDGFDELESDRASEFVALLRNAMNRYESAVCIVTSRVSGYHRLIESEADLVAQIEPLTKSDVALFSRNWFGNEVEARRFQSLVTSSPLIEWLTTRPLFLGLLAHVWSERGQLPEQGIYRLYEQATDLLLGRWDIEKGLLRRYQVPDSYKKLALAVWAAETNADPGFPLTLQSCANSLAKWFDERPSIKNTAELLDEIVKGSGILVNLGENRWEFSHHTLRTFFSASFLLSMPVAQATNLIGSSDQLEKWRESVALAVSTLPEDQGMALLERIVRTSGQTRLKAKEILRLASELSDKLEDGGKPKGG